MPVPRSKKKQGGQIDLDVKGKPIGAIASAYVATKENIKQLDKQADSLKPELKKFLKKHGKPDANGTIVAKATWQGQEYILLDVCRQSTEEKASAIRTIKKSFPRLAKQLIESVEILRVDVLEQMINDGKLTEAEVRKLVDVKTNYAFQVKKSEY